MLACVSTLGGSAAVKQQQLLRCYYTPEINVNGKQHVNTNGSLLLYNELTENIDKGVGQKVAVFIGDITLVDSAGSSLYISEYDGVILHLSAEILRGICSWTTEVTDVTIALSLRTQGTFYREASVGTNMLTGYHNLTTFSVLIMICLKH